VRSHEEFEDRMVTTRESGFQIALKRFPLGMLRGEGLHAVEGKVKLNGHWLLTPERAIVVERGDAFRYWNKIRRPWFRHLLDKSDDGLLGSAVVP
jgi:hypothetical protein